ncbi:MAG: hypothetical protein R3B48_28650 [Kofleriaceae bacterium]
MTPERAQLVLRWAAALTMIGLALMLWAIFQPTALPVVISMSLGQAVGTSAFALFGWVVLSDLLAQRRELRLRRAQERAALSPSAMEAAAAAAAATAAVVAATDMAVAAGAQSTVGAAAEAAKPARATPEDAPAAAKATASGEIAAPGGPPAKEQV